MTTSLIATEKSWYSKSGFECVVKQLRMVLYKSGCNNSNDCELPSGQATPSTLVKDVTCDEAACRMAVIHYHICMVDQVPRWLVRVTHQDPLCRRQLGVGRLTVDLIGECSSQSQRLGCTCENKNTCENARVISQSIECLTGRKGMVTCNIHCIFP